MLVCSHAYAPIPSTTVRNLYDFARPQTVSRLPSFIQHISGHCRAVVRRKRAYASKTFRLKADAEHWAREREAIEQTNLPGQSVLPKPPA